MKRLLLSLTLAIVTILLIAIPVLASCYAYIYIEESNGTSYDDLPLICSTNISALVQGGFISSTGLDTRVITGDGDPLPHMLANDKILFVSDLAAYEDKTLIFYTGATSLSSFPIIPGYGGYITTPDDPDLELTYVIELLADGYFDASAGSNKNILYKEDAFKMSISAANTLRVAALEAGDVEQWEMHYSSFTSGEHTIYVMANGLAAYLYVDDFEVAKDTVNLFDDTSQTINGDDDPELHPNTPRTFWAENLYWAFWIESSSDDNIHYRTSSDGDSWNSEQTFAVYNSADLIEGFSVWFDGTYCHIAYGDYDSSTENFRYRRGDPESDGSITWSAVWQTASGGSETYIRDAMVTADSSHYPMIVYYNANTGNDSLKIIKSSTNDGTWSTAGGYPIDANVYQSMGFAVEPGGDEMYLTARREDDDDTIYGRYYNGSTWGGSFETVVADTGGTVYPYCCDVVGDDDGNFYIGWTEGSLGPTWKVHLRIRYSGGTFSDVIDLAGDVGDSAQWVTLSYNEDADVVYIFYGRDGYVRAMAIQGTALSGEYTFFGHDESYFMSATPYSDHIGILVVESGSLAHGAIDFTAYTWNDNSNNWTWMMNNVMPYMSDAIIAIDGVSQLEYKPATIIQGTTLPDEESDHDGTITWGSNPSGVAVSHSELICEEAGESASYYYFEPGSEDIIKPEPAEITGGMDLEALRDNPLYPLVQVLSIDGFLNERLVWLGIAWFIVLIAMLGVHLGFDTRPNTEKPQHFILTTITGLGLSIVFYTMGIFDLWVIIMMGILLGGAIIWERQPVI